jgi:hypothetical protein
MPMLTTFQPVHERPVPAHEVCPGDQQRLVSPNSQAGISLSDASPRKPIRIWQQCGKPTWDGQNCWLVATVAFRVQDSFESCRFRGANAFRSESIDHFSGGALH